MTKRNDMTQEERKELALIMLQLYLSNVSAACRAAQISRRTFYSWLDNDDNFAARVYEIKESIIDYVEDRQLALIAALDGPQIRFFLQHQAKQRGYGKEARISHEYPDGLPAPSQHLHLHLPKQPETLADWEAQVKELRQARTAIPAPQETSAEQDIIEAEVE